MTTNHRPTLESKRGRDIAIKDTIQHARSTKGQTSLKLRSDIAGTQIDHTRARKALDELESESKRHKKAEDCIILHTDSENDKQILTSKEIEKNLSPVAVSEDAPNPQEDKTSVGVSSVSNTRTGEISEEIDPHNDAGGLGQCTLEDSENSESSDSDDEDTEALMKELEKVRREKAGRNENITGSSPVLKNPLIAADGTETVSKKKSWRGTSAFSRSKKSDNHSFTTDSLSSETHKRFLSKYFR